MLYKNLLELTLAKCSPSFRVVNMVFLLLPFAYYASPNPEAWFLFLTTSRWFAVRLDAICAILVIVVAFGSLILATSKYRCEELFVVWLQFIAAFTVLKLISCHLVRCHILFGSNESHESVCRVSGQVWFSSVVRAEWSFGSRRVPSVFRQGEDHAAVAAHFLYIPAVASGRCEERTKCSVTHFVHLRALGFHIRAVRISWLYLPGTLGWENTRQERMLASLPGGYRMSRCWCAWHAFAIPNYSLVTTPNHNI